MGAYAGWGAVAAWIAFYLAAALSTPSYTMTGNRLSDLGNPAAPADWAFDAACILAGLLFLPFAWALGASMSPRMRFVGRIILSAGALALIGVGVFPEESPHNLHFIMSALFFILLMVAVSHYAFAMFYNPKYGKVSGLLGVVTSALALFFVVLVAMETARDVSVAGGALSNVLEHLTVFAALAWAAWNAWQLFQIGRAVRTAGT
jgi:hypothetical membrane protein